MRNMLLAAWGALILILIVVVVSLWMHRVPSAPTTTASITTVNQQPTTTLPTNSDRAFIRVVQAPEKGVRGEMYTALLASNAWSKCMADVHTPDGKLFPMDVKSSEASVASVGGYVWNWQIPTNGPTGIWTIRFLCGKYDDLASRDVGVTIE